MTSVSLADELQELVGDLGEQRLVLEERRREPVHGLGFGRHVALGIDEAVELAARRDAVDELDAADLDQPVAAFGIEAGGLGIENDFAHACDASALPVDCRGSSRQ